MWAPTSSAGASAFTRIARALLAAESAVAHAWSLRYTTYYIGVVIQWACHQAVRETNQCKTRSVHSGTTASPGGVTHLSISFMKSVAHNP